MEFLWDLYGPGLVYLVSAWHQSWHSHDTWHGACVVTRDVTTSPDNTPTKFLILLGNSSEHYHSKLSSNDVIKPWQNPGISWNNSAIIISSFQIISSVTSDENHRREKHSTLLETQATLERRYCDTMPPSRHHHGYNTSTTHTRSHSRLGSTGLSLRTSAKHGRHSAPALQKYLYFSTPRPDLTNCDLYKNSEPNSGNNCNVISKLNHSDCFNDTNSQKTKSVFKINGSELQQNMYVLPLDQHNMPVYHNTNMDTSVGHMTRVYHQKYEGFRPILTSRHARDPGSWSGYQVRIQI